MSQGRVSAGSVLIWTVPTHRIPRTARRATSRSSRRSVAAPRLSPDCGGGHDVAALRLRRFPVQPPDKHGAEKRPGHESRQRISGQSGPEGRPDTPEGNRLARLDRDTAEHDVTTERAEGGFHMVLFTHRKPARGNDEIGGCGHLFQLPGKPRAIVGAVRRAKDLNACMVEEDGQHRRVDVPDLSGIARPTSHSTASSPTASARSSSAPQSARTPRPPRRDSRPGIHVRASRPGQRLWGGRHARLHRHTEQHEQHRPDCRPDEERAKPIGQDRRAVFRRISAPRPRSFLWTSSRSQTGAAMAIRR